MISLSKNPIEAFKNKLDSGKEKNKEFGTLKIDDLKPIPVVVLRRSVPTISITGKKAITLSFNQSLIKEEKYAPFFKGKKILLFFSKERNMFAFGVPTSSSEEGYLLHLTKQDHACSISIKSILKLLGIDRDSIKGHYKPYLRTILAPNLKQTHYMVFFVSKNTN